LFLLLGLVVSVVGLGMDGFDMIWYGLTRLCYWIDVYLRSDGFLYNAGGELSQIHKCRTES
jgi:hypothetical protein